MSLVKKLNFKPVDKSHIKMAPNSNGVYIFVSNDKKPIYIGKSINLKARLTSYTMKALGEKTSKMMAEAKYFSFIEVSSEIEALLLEASLIQKYMPHYNIELKDDKHPLYIKITKDKYPRILTARKQDLLDDVKIYFGPFPSSYSVRAVLNVLRKIFPYADHMPAKKPCLYSQLGLCIPCPSEIESESDLSKMRQLKRKYMLNVKKIQKILEGDFKSVRKQMEKEMEKHSKALNFEEAKKIRNQIMHFDYVTQPVTPLKYYLKNPNLIYDIRADEAKSLTALISRHITIGKPIDRIECFDIAHISGSFPAASMVTFINSEAEKSLYRHFRIRQSKGADDISSMKEVARRRFANLKKWGKPDLIVVDGGKAQVNAFLGVFERSEIPVVGLAKRYETLIIPRDNGYEEVRVPKGPALNLLKRIRDESHRFARRYHKHLLSKNLIPS